MTTNRKTKKTTTKAPPWPAVPHLVTAAEWRRSPRAVREWLHACALVLRGTTQWERSMRAAGRAHEAYLDNEDAGRMEALQTEAERSKRASDNARIALAETASLAFSEARRNARAARKGGRRD